MTWDTTWRRELPKQFTNAFGIFCDSGVNLCIGPFQVDVGNQCGATMSGSREVDGVDIVILNQPIDVDIDKTQSSRCAPMSEQAWFDVYGLQWLSEQGIFL